MQMRSFKQHIKFVLILVSEISKKVNNKKYLFLDATRNNVDVKLKATT
jgi:hypothetical protein